MRGARTAALLALLAAAPAGCITVPAAEKSALQQRIGGTQMAPGELRARVRDLAGRFSGEIEALADGIIAATGDPSTRLELTRFKINAVSQMQTALFLADPVAALVDAWALVAQMQQSLEGIEERGELSPGAVAYARQRFDGMEAVLGDLWSRLTGESDVAEVQARVEEWAADHPFDSLAARESTVGLLAELSTRGGVGAGSAASILLEDTQDLARRMDLLAVWAPRQARWQAELFLREMLADPTLLDGAEDPAAVLEQIAQLLAQTEQIPTWLTAERKAVLADIDGERRAVQAFVTGEREALVAALRQERTALAAEGAGLVDRTFERATALADRIVRRLFLLVVLAGILAVLVALVATRGRRPRGLEVRRGGEA